MDPSLIEEVTRLAVRDVEEENLEFIELALSNTVVLREIFKFLPASTLKNCSLVNKLWKNECYLHCRDQRKWMAKISSESPCALLVNFNELVGAMTLVPYNGLSLHVNQTRSNYSCLCNSPEEVFTNVLDKLIWRHLDILIDFKGDWNERCSSPCAAVGLAMTLLEQKIVGVESLKFRLFDDLQPFFDSTWPPALPNLKTICFPQRCQRELGLPNLAPTSFSTRLTNAAPNLMEIKGVIDCERLPLFPEEKWGSVKDFSYSHSASGNEIASQFASKGPHLRKLRLQFFSDCQPTTARPIFNVLIELSQMTLEDLEIRSSAYNFHTIEGSLQMPQLPELRLMRLHMTSGFRQAIGKVQFLLSQQDGQGFPQLEEFHLSVDTIDDRFGGFLPRPDLRDESDSYEIGNLQLPIQSFASVSKLRLDLDPSSSSFVQVKSLFPAVTDMHMICGYYDYDDEPSRLPYKQIFRLWQNLKTMSVSYDYGLIESAYKLDAAFCGLHEKEIELLEQQDDDYLMAIELVPIAPCVLTMRNLQSFTMEYPQRDVGANEQETCMTRVARMLVTRYLPNAQVNVP